MITLTLFFWMLVILFGVIGAMRGWAKELLVSFSVLVSLFIMSVLGSFGPLKIFASPLGAQGFWPPALLLLVLVLAGYQTPMLVRFASGKFARDKFSDMLLGFFIGMINGYLIFGCLWYFMASAGYPFAPGITKPPDPQPFIVGYLPPVYLTGPVLYGAVGLAFVFVLLVFI
jgi:uncharacterized membrane protein required for colicin V production